MQKNNSINLPSPAKLNLFLHITGQREDGYHTLQTLFQFLDFCDELHFTLRNDGQIELIADIQNLSIQDNIIFKAAIKLQDYTQTTLGATIHLNKKLPIGGGLGGGSSNAATTLLALNYLWNTQLSLNTLAEIGLALGADVPVFIKGHAAWAEGIGEILTPLMPAEKWYAVIVPPCSVSTKKIFTHPALTRHSKPITIDELSRMGGRNDCEPIVRQLYPTIDKALTWLTQFGGARLTGTGCCVFAGFSTQTDAEAVLQQLPSDLTGFIAKGINYSPLHRALDKIYS